jgi:hypothetical protein
VRLECKPITDEHGRPHGLEHSIPPTKSLRYSITFRALKAPSRNAAPDAIAARGFPFWIPRTACRGT